MIYKNKYVKQLHLYNYLMDYFKKLLSFQYMSKKLLLVQKTFLKIFIEE